MINMYVDTSKGGSFIEWVLDACECLCRIVNWMIDDAKVRGEKINVASMPFDIKQNN